MIQFSLRTCLLTFVFICLFLLLGSAIENIRRDSAVNEQISKTSRLIRDLGGEINEATAIIPVEIFKKGNSFRLNFGESLRKIEIKGTINNSHDLQLLPNNVHRLKFCVSVDSVDKLPELLAVRNLEMELVDGFNKQPISLDSKKLLRFRFSNQLLSLSLKGDQLTDDFVAMFQDCMDIGILHISGKQITGSGVTKLQTGKITDLWLLGSLQDSHLADFPPFPHLGFLCISSNNPINENGLKWLKHSRQLETIIMCGGPYTATAIVDVANLRTLELVGATFDDFSELKNIRSLKRLRIINSSFSDEQFSQIASMPELRELEIANTSVTSAGLSRLRLFRKLEYFKTNIPLKSKDITSLVLPPSLSTFSNRHLTTSPDELRRIKLRYPNVSFGYQEYTAYKESEDYRARID